MDGRGKGWRRKVEGREGVGWEVGLPGPGHEH